MVSPHSTLRHGWMTRARNLIAAALMTAVGCEIADFDVERSGTATIPSRPDAEAITVMELDGFEIVLAEIEDTENIGPEDISGAELRRFTIEVLDPADAELSFVDGIEIYAEAPDLERVRIAHLDEVPRGAQRIELEVDGVDLHDYIIAPVVTLSAVVDGDAPETDVRVRAVAVLNIGATLRGACDHG
ncbi:MAG: hypothetical protein IAG13_35855 [Deltaproteobacteria bacterium]|nr:hypothetical protein [Nannocystaceae bacterium]